VKVDEYKVGRTYEKMGDKHTLTWNPIVAEKSGKSCFQHWRNGGHEVIIDIHPLEGTSQ
jgi:hypothetical protein